MSFLAISLISCLLTLFLLDLVLRGGLVRSPFPAWPPPVDSPGRAGGVAMVAAVMASGCLASVIPIGALGRSASGLAPVLAGGMAVFAIGWLDDMKPLPPAVKLLGQIGAASLSYALGLRAGFLPPGAINYLFTVFCLVGGANAMNLVDGLDGLAGGIGAVASATLFFVARDSGHVDAAVLAAGIAGSTLAFLWFNLPPARVFMGDSGSNWLGFGLVSVTLLLSGGAGGFGDFSSGILLLAVPIVETATSIARRLGEGRSPLAGDLNHIHHRLLRQGWPVGAILLLSCSLTGLLSVFVLFGDALTWSRLERTASNWLALGGLLLVSSIYVFAHARLSPAHKPGDASP